MDDRGQLFPLRAEKANRLITGQHVLQVSMVAESAGRLEHASAAESSRMNSLTRAARSSSRMQKME
jgi:hypothetical protein